MTGNLPASLTWFCSSHMKVSDVRQLIVSVLQELGYQELHSRGERLLTQDRFYVGCRFEFDAASAIWIEAAGMVRFFDASGKLLKVVRVPAVRDSALDEAA